MKSSYFGLCINLWLILIFSCTCKPTSMGSRTDLNRSTEIIHIQNNLPIRNTGGHIQGVQYFEQDEKSFYFFSGSSDKWAYYAIADAKSRQVIHVDTFLTEPFRHAGGFQILGDLLAVGIEDNAKKDKSKVLLYRIVDAENGKLNLLKTISRQGEYKRYTAGCVGIAIIDQKLVLAVGNWDTKHIDFYHLPVIELDNPTRLFTKIQSIDTQILDRSDWIEGKWYPYQNINLFLDKEGSCYLLGMGEDRINKKEVLDLYLLKFSANNSITMRKTSHTTFKKEAGTSFRWGGGIMHVKDYGIQIMSCGEQIRDNIALYISSWPNKK